MVVREHQVDQQEVEVVEQDDRPDRKVYSITDAGRADAAIAGFEAAATRVSVRLGRRSISGSDGRSKPVAMTVMAISRLKIRR